MPTKHLLHVNGSVHAVEADPERTSQRPARRSGLTGAHYGCGEGQCGACTVLIDGQPPAPASRPSERVGKGSVTTIEGLEKNGKLHPVQQAFLDARRPPVRLLHVRA